ncbi:MAG: T9SS type A sorting domain-containing protein [Saprospiraceae bacterium]|nr:T9SS type A sorting domain-containing protein [Saprospiraceae bacterium]
MRFQLPPFCLLAIFFTLIQQTIAQQVITVSDNDLLPNTNYNWTANNTYLLDGFVFLEAGASLSIEAGTVIKAKNNPSTGDATTALIISRGATIEAIGSPLHPILFTPEQDIIADTSDLQISQRGLWGGLIILGGAPVNAAQGSPTLEGLPPLSKAQFGGQDEFDNSGILRYISIRHAGAAGLAGFTAAGVGQPSVIRHIEVISAEGDGFRFLGGMAHTKYLAAAFNGEDQFEWDLGFRGLGENWFSIHAENAGDQALEGRGGHDLSPDKVSKPQITDATFIGPGSEASINIPSAILFHEATAGSLGNSIITEFPNFGLEVEDLEDGVDALAQLEACQLIIYDNVWWDLGEAANLFEVSTTNADLDDVAFPLNNFLIPYRNIFDDPRFFSIARSPEEPVQLNPTLNGRCEIFNFGAFHLYWWLDEWAALNHYGIVPSCSEPYFGYFDLPLNDLDTIPIENYQQLIDLDRARQYAEDTGLDIDQEFGGRRCPGCDPTNPSPTSAQSIRRDRTRRRRSVQKLLRGDDFCWLEEWQWTTYVYEVDFESPVDSFVTRRFFAVADQEVPQITLVPNENLGEFPFEVVAIDNDTATVSFRTESRQGSSLVDHIWTATDFCGNSTSYTIRENINSTNYQTWYLDRDGDGLGDPDTRFSWPIRPNNVDAFVDQAGDCHDQDASLGLSCLFAAAPDICNLAEPLAIGQTSERYTSFNSTLDLTFPKQCFTSNPVGDLWFSFIAPPEGTLTIEVVDQFLSDHIKSLELYRGDCSDLELLTYACETSLQVSQLVPDEVLWLRVPVEELSAFRITSYVPASPPNDLCSSAIELPVNDECVPMSFAFLNSTFETYPAVATEPGFAGDLWFKAIIPSSGQLTMKGSFVSDAYAGDCNNFRQLPMDHQEFSDIYHLRHQPGETVYFRVINSMNAYEDNMLNLCLTIRDEIPLNELSCNTFQLDFDKSCLAFSSSSPPTFCLSGQEECIIQMEFEFQLVDTCIGGNLRNISLNASIDLNADGSLDQILLQSSSNSLQAWPNEELSLNLPIGSHILYIQSEEVEPDAFFEENGPFYFNIEIPINIEDCTTPTISCISALAVELLPTSPDNPMDTDNDGLSDLANVQVYASDFIVGSTAGCSGANEFAIYRKSALEQAGILQSDGSFQADWIPEIANPTESLFLTCSDTTQTVEVLAFGLSPNGNWSTCNSQIIVQDNLEFCNPPQGPSAISGQIRGPEGIPIEGVEVRLSGHQQAITITNEAGEYGFADLPSGQSYTVTPFKNDDPLNGVSTIDIALMGRNILGLQTFTEAWQYLAADVNNDGRATTLDIILTRKLILGTMNDFSDNTSWRFIAAFFDFDSPSDALSTNFPEMQSIVNLPETGLSTIDFQGVKVADINNNSRKNREQIIVRSRQSPLPLVVQMQTVPKQNVIQLDFRLPPQDAVVGLQGTLRFDTENLAFQDILYDLADESNFGWLYLQDGAISFSWDWAEPFSDQQPGQRLFTLVFQQLSQDLPENSIWLEDKPTSIESFSSLKQVRGLKLQFPAANSDLPKLFSNAPNPFYQETSIHFYLPINMEAAISIVDIEGKEVFRKKGWHQAGHHFLQLRAVDLNGSGMYFYCLTAENYTRTGKMILLK